MCFSLVFVWIFSQHFCCKRQSSMNHFSFCRFLIELLVPCFFIINFNIFIFIFVLILKNPNDSRHVKNYIIKNFSYLIIILIGTLYIYFAIKKKKLIFYSWKISVRLFQFRSYKTKAAFPFTRRFKFLNIWRNI